MTPVTAKKEKFNFEAAIERLLQLMINALYSNKEIFLRELISNASDAADKLRFEGLSNPALFENDSDLDIHITFDEKANTLTVSDNGIGMDREEIVENLGTIAKSGTAEFLESLTGDQASDAKLIGQFGVGFYSAFIVADKVVVISRKAGLTKDNGVRWESEGKGDYTVENAEKEKRGTDVVLYIKKEEKEFLDPFQLRSIITKYSDHINIPIFMKKDKTEKEGDEWEKVNRATALWTLPRNQIKDEEYQELYKHIAHDFENPILWSHNKVEGKLEYTSLLYIPSHAPFDLWHRDHRHGLKLYVKRVFIMDDAEQFLPMYLRFVKGVIDSNDLPLNISREILQRNAVVDKIRSAIIKRVLNMLEKLAKDNPEQYAIFWNEFGRVLKEGPAEDFENKETIAKLLRFASTHDDTDTQSVSLQDYVDRMQSGQDKIYYITADSFIAAKNSPHLEVFRKKGIEVLLLSDRVDEWLVNYLTEYDGKLLQSVAKGDIDLGKLEDQEFKKEQEKNQDEFASLLDHMKKVLGEAVKDVRLTYRLTDSPACIVADENDLNINMQRILKAAGQEVPVTKPILELNPDHQIIQRLKQESDDDCFDKWCYVLLDQAVLSDGGQLEDPATFVKQLNALLLGLSD